MRLFALALVGLLATSSTAAAVEGLLKRHGGSDNIIVWRNSNAHSEGLSLISAGVHRTNPALLYPLVACIVDAGTKVVITDAGFVTHDIMVIEGSNAGCRGNIAMENFTRK
jgi:hypothetical protein